MAADKAVSNPTVCSLCLGTGKVFHENPPRKDTPWSRCHCIAIVNQGLPMLELADKFEKWPNVHLQPSENRLVLTTLRAVASDHVRARLTEGQQETLRRIANAKAAGISLHPFWQEIERQWSPDRPASDQGAVREALKSARSEFERQLHKCRSDGDADYFEKELTKINEALASILPERSASAIGTPDAREAAMAEREACAKVADEHAAWAEDKIDSEISIFGTISNAANDVAEMIRHRDDPNWQTHRKALALPAPGQRGEDK